MATVLDRNRELVASTWKGLGWNDTMIAGMLGRASRESSFNMSIVNPNDAGPGNHSKGLFQWNRGRLAGLMKFAKQNGVKWNDPVTQAKYTHWELTEGGEKKAYERLKNARNVQEAVDAAMTYTRPKGSVTGGKLTPRSGLHYKETLAAAKKFAGIPVDPLDAMNMQGSMTAAMEKDDGRPTTAGLKADSTDTAAQQVINDANKLLSANTDNAGVRDSNSVMDTDILSGLMNPKANSNPAPAPPSISELASLFQPRIQWDSL